MNFSGLEELDTLASGGRTHYWFNDNVKLGMTLSAQQQAEQDSSLNGIDLTLRKSTGTWVRMEAASSEGAGSGALNSNDGGFVFESLNNGHDPDAESTAYRI